MLVDTINTIDLVFVCTVYFIGVASPGPSNLAIMATAMQNGRKKALFLAMGVETGSLFWGVLAGFGLAAVLATYSNLLVAMKIIAGLYLLWLAFKSARSALVVHSEELTTIQVSRNSDLKHFSRGVLLHLTNPKAIFVWLSIISIGLPAGSTTASIFMVVVCCSIISTIVFAGYAFLFSTKTAREAYLKFRRGFDSVMCVCFGYAGIRLLSGRI